MKYIFVLVSTLFLIGCGSKVEDRTESRTPATMLEAVVRSQIQESTNWKVREENIKWDPTQTAIIICDMWNRHWCDSATARVARMAPAVNQFIKKARELGVTIVHAPSSTIEFYQDHPARKRILSYPHIEPPITLDYWFYPDSTREAPLPIDDSDEGCDSPGNEPVKVYSRQIASIEIDDQDLISDSGQEIYNYFEANAIDNVVLCGVHTNMCVLGRTFGVRGQVKLGKNVLLARDLTDAMYNPEMPPYVSHWEGVDLVIGHIEKYWAPTVLSTDLVN